MSLATSQGVKISKLACYACVCEHVLDFNERNSCIAGN